MNSTIRTLAFCFFLFSCSFLAGAQPKKLDDDNIVWTSQSKNSSESMPCGGGSIGLNVWTENNDILFYMARSGSFDENNALLKAGRVRLKLSPNPFAKDFKQTLDLKTGAVTISGKNGKQTTTVFCWVDVFRPVIHFEITSNRPVSAEAIYENWRYQDRPSKGKANNANSYKWAPQGNVETWKDEIAFKDNSVLFYHRNKAFTVFDVTVKQQGLDSVKEQLLDPLKGLTFGGLMKGEGMKSAGTTSGNYIDTDYKAWKLVSKKPVKKQTLTIYLHTEQAQTFSQWVNGLNKTVNEAKNDRLARTNTLQWWKQFWEKSFIFINPGTTTKDSVWQTGRNYQLFRYMLGCNAFGSYPTKFNGGLFTYDPSLVDSSLKFTPDFRNWGGGTSTAQNQRLVYFPFIKSGDADLMKPQFDFYLHLLKNAELRSKVYWNHDGACFTEQLENFGLPNPAEYGWKRPEGYDKGMEYNAWLEYEWDTVLEFCLMILETERYAGKDISEYVPLIESCLRFFNEHYQYLAKQRGSRTFDGDGQLVLYPGSGAETYKMAYNATSTVAGLKTVLTRLLELPSNYLDEKRRSEWATMLKRIPPITFSEFNGHTTIAPAKTWQFVANKNMETVQLYPVFPWGMYGVGKPNLDLAVNTWNYDTTVVKFKSHVGWRQYNIFAPRLGLTKEAAELNTSKLQNSGRRFPAFWGPGYDWTPDHNWGGSGMIGLQEMLLQTDGKKIFLFPAWPKEWDVHFKLHASYQTTVEASVKNGKVEWIKVFPETRTKDIINLLTTSQ
jgi:hypothetical protein